MTDATIRAALRKAAWAECEARAQVNECEDKRCPRREPCQWCAAGASAAVAAFLRALPDTFLPFSDGSGNTYIAAYQSDMLADAVVLAAVRAARGGEP